MTVTWYNQRDMVSTRDQSFWGYDGKERKFTHNDYPTPASLGRCRHVDA